MAIRVRWVTDPVCARSWAAEPALRRLIWDFGDQVELRWVMSGQIRSFGPELRDSETGAGKRRPAGADPAADLSEHWLELAADSRQPFDPRIWNQGPPASSHPACQAVIAACEQGSAAGYRYLRRLREGLICEHRRLDHIEALLAEAGPAGLDAARFEIDLRSHAIVEQFGAQIEESRSITDADREAGGVVETDGRERLASPTARFIAADGSEHRVHGPQPYAAYREAAIAAGAQPADPGPADPLAAIERFGRCSTRELEELTGRPRPPLEAELWALARDWRIKPVQVLTGVLWERV